MQNLSTISNLFVSAPFPGFEPIEPQPESLAWYKSLDLHTRINAKDCFKMLCGAEFSAINNILGPRLTIDVLYNKLKMEGFEV